MSIQKADCHICCGIDSKVVTFMAWPGVLALVLLIVVIIPCILFCMAFYHVTENNSYGSYQAYGCKILICIPLTSLAGFAIIWLLVPMLLHDKDVLMYYQIAIAFQLLIFCYWKYIFFSPDWHFGTPAIIEIMRWLKPVIYLVQFIALVMSSLLQALNSPIPEWLNLNFILPICIIFIAGDRALTLILKEIEEVRELQQLRRTYKK